VGTRELPEDHLLSSLGGDGLEQILGSGTRVEVWKESIDTGFTPDVSASDRYDLPSGQTLAKVNKLPDRLKVVSVFALLGGGSTTVELHVADQGGVSDFLVGHELNEGDVIGVQSRFGKLLWGESCYGIVEEIQLDPLLVECQVQGLKVD
jgi:hypothetical protein